MPGLLKSSEKGRERIVAIETDGLVLTDEFFCTYSSMTLLFPKGKRTSCADKKAGTRNKTGIKMIIL